MPGRAAIVTRAEQPDPARPTFWPDPPRTPAPAALAAAGHPDRHPRHRRRSPSGTSWTSLDWFAATPSGPHRVEHIETLPGALIGRFVRQGVVASMQPTHCTHYTRADHTDNWSTRLGADRADRAWRCRDLHDAGVPLVLGSDWPVAPFDPRRVLADAQLRRPAGEPDVPPVQPHQGWTRAPRCGATPPPPRSPRARPVAPGGSRRAPART